MAAGPWAAEAKQLLRNGWRPSSSGVLSPKLLAFFRGRLRAVGWILVHRTWAAPGPLGGRKYSVPTEPGRLRVRVADKSCMCWMLVLFALRGGREHGRTWAIAAVYGLGRSDGDDQLILSDLL